MKFRMAYICALCVSLVTLDVTGQVRGTCGVTDPTELLERVTMHQEYLATAPLQMRNALVKYCPITFHLVADGSGNGRAREEQALEQLAKLNEHYAPQEMIFYIDEIRFIDHTLIFTEPSNGTAVFQMNFTRDQNAMNIWVTQSAENGGSNPGITLGYYSPQQDWIVIRKDEFNGFNNTLAHEIGHFFSLPHPHSGWECEPYNEAMHGNPVSSIWSPCNGSLRVEFQNGSNCQIAGDRICDTNPDYNFGFGWSGCNEYTPTVRDPNNDIVDVIENNHMGYFIGCTNYMFTPNQQSIIQSDFFTSSRSYLRTGYIPDQDPVMNNVVYNYPINGEESGAVDFADLDWEDTPGATHYLVIIDRSATFSFVPRRFLVNESFLTVTGLAVNINYYWRVWPYNESKTGARWGATQNFHTGEPSAVKTISSVDILDVFPNPAVGSDVITLHVEANSPFDAAVTLYNLVGDRVWERQGLHFESGQTVNMPLLVGDALLPGLYLVKIQSSDGGIISRKLNIL
jgi:hypothetical protein